MNARILVADDGAGKALALLAAATLMGEPEKGGVPMDPRIFGDDFPREKSLGFMEFFDWLAGTSDKELLMLAKEHSIHTAAEAPLGDKARAVLGLAVWERL
jgi:hypothetical protein